MSKVMIWDLPMRIFHWAFSICLSLALLIAFTVDEDSPLFQWHMLLGLTAAFLLFVRMVVGFIGGRYSWFRGLLFHPVESVSYLVSAPFGKAKRYIGHNPGTAIAALAMFLLVIGLTWTGLSMSTESSKDLHEILAYGMLAAIGAHLIGLVIHTVYHHENISLSMITGKKEAPDEASIQSSRPLAGTLTLLIVALGMGLVFKGYDRAASTVTLPVFGTIALGEAEEDGAENEEHESGARSEDEDEDDD